MPSPSLVTPDTPPTPIQIHRPLEFVRQTFPDALGLENRVVLSAAVLKDLEANVEEAVGDRSWLDVTAVLPPALSPGTTCMYASAFEVF
jgi:hypothetical protein